MGYRRYSKSRYWGRSSYYRRPYDSSGSRYHYVFGYNTGEAATIVREIFFSLSGDALNRVLDEYGTKYGKGAKAYAKSTIYKWETGSVNMSNAMIGRLLDFLPPLMTPEQKNRVVEAIWKAHAKRSLKYAYIGPDADVDAFLEDLNRYFNNLGVTHAIPGDIERAFSWLADDDAIAKQQLLNHFMEKQMDAALAAGRYYVKLILDRISADTDEQISKFEHTVIVGNHQVVIKADRLRPGYVFSNSPNDFYKLPFKISPRSWLFAAAAAIIGFVVLTYHGSNNSQSATVAQAQSQAQVQSQPVDQIQQYVPPQPTPKPIQMTTKPVFVPRKSTAREVAVAQTSASTVSQVVSTSALTKAPAVANGCVNYTVASVNGDGSDVVLSNGKHYSVSDTLARASASGWSTGDEVVGCTSDQEDSLKRNFQTVQATIAGQASIKSYGCRTLYVGYTNEDGSKIVTTDGTKMSLLDNALARASASGWSTGESVSVCTVKQGDVAYAGIKRNFQEVEATIDHFGSGQAEPASCTPKSIAHPIDDDGVIRVGAGSYRIENDFMKAEANAMAIGDPVLLCTYSSNGSVYASIAKSDFQIVQAYKVP